MPWSRGICDEVFLEDISLQRKKTLKEVILEDIFIYRILKKHLFLEEIFLEDIFTGRIYFDCDLSMNYTPLDTPLL